MSYDPICYEAAKHFLSDCPVLNNSERMQQLAQHIQDAIEHEIRWMSREEEVKGGKGACDVPISLSPAERQGTEKIKGDQ